MLIKIIHFVLCKLKFHTLLYSSNILLKDEGVRWVKFTCPLCGDYKMNCFELGKEPSPWR